MIFIHCAMMGIFEKPLLTQIKSKIVSRLCIASGYFNYFNRFQLLLAAVRSNWIQSMHKVLAADGGHERLDNLHFLFLSSLLIIFSS